MIRPVGRGREEIIGTTEPAGALFIAGREKQLVDVSVEVRPVIVAREALERCASRWVQQRRLAETVWLGAGGLIPRVPEEAAVSGAVRIQTYDQ